MGASPFGGDASPQTPGWDWGERAQEWEGPVLHRAVDEMSLDRLLESCSPGTGGSPEEVRRRKRVKQSPPPFWTLWSLFIKLVGDPGCWARNPLFAPTLFSWGQEGLTYGVHLPHGNPAWGGDGETYGNSFQYDVRSVPSLAELWRCSWRVLFHSDFGLLFLLCSFFFAFFATAIYMDFFCLCSCDDCFVFFMLLAVLINFLTSFLVCLPCGRGKLWNLTCLVNH